MSQLFNGVNSLSLNLEHLADMCEFQLESETSTIADGIYYTANLARYVLDRLFGNLTDKSY